MKTNLSRTSTVLASTLLALSTALPSHAEIGAADPTPAASLLLPYFEVDLDRPNGSQTTLTVSNATAGPVIAHFALWTDLGVPTLSWNAYLTGYDLLSLDLYDIFVNGTFPATPLTATDGAFSRPAGAPGDPALTSCLGQLPLPTIPSILLDHVRSLHTGGPSILYGGQCGGRDLGDNIARGYLTVDVVNLCTLSFPNEPGYFVSGGTGQASNANALLGDYRWSNRSQGKAFSETLVHLEASSTDARTQPGQYTFYARYSGGADNRESLPTSFWSRYVQDPKPRQGTYLTVWRDSQQSVLPFACGSLPSPFPLGANQVVLFDAQENPNVLNTSPSSPSAPGFATPFPAEASRVEVGSAAMPGPFNDGWAYLNLNNTIAGSTVGQGVVQNWVSVRIDDRFTSTGYDAYQLDNAAEASNLLLPDCSLVPAPAGCSN
jgi:hypothetical protein